MNYQQLQELYQELAPRGFTVLAFPCNQFGRQEPGTEAEIKAFATGVYGAEFPLFAKVRVNGADAHPLWKFLKSSLKGTFGQSIKWNFTKVRKPVSLRSNAHSNAVPRGSARHST